MLWARIRYLVLRGKGPAGYRYTADPEIPELQAVGLVFPHLSVHLPSEKQITNRGPGIKLPGPYLFLTMQDLLNIFCLLLYIYKIEIKIVST